MLIIDKDITCIIPVVVNKTRSLVNWLKYLPLWLVNLELIFFNNSKRNMFLRCSSIKSLFREYWKKLYNPFLKFVILYCEYCTKHFYQVVQQGLAENLKCKIIVNVTIATQKCEYFNHSTYSDGWQEILYQILCLPQRFACSLKKRSNIEASRTMLWALKDMFTTKH